MIFVQRKKLNRVGFMLLTAALLASCGQSNTGPDPLPPASLSLTLTPTAVNFSAGDQAQAFTANVQNSSEVVSWTLSGPGSVTPPTGLGTVYAPPESVDELQTATLTAILGSTGVSATAFIAIYPADVTPPTEPPVNPDPPAEPDPPTDPDPPTEPTPAPEFGVKTNTIEPLELNSSGTATAYVNSTAENASGNSVTFAWSQESGPAEVMFDSPTTEDVTVTFTKAGTYVLNVTATSGEETASAKVNVTVNPYLLTVEGLWDATYVVGGTSHVFSFDLTQKGSDVSGKHSIYGQMVGTFDGTRLYLESTQIIWTLTAITKDNTMNGIFNDAFGYGTVVFTATR